MQLKLYDSNLNALRIIDTFESLIWTEKYNEYGDFELYVNAEDYDVNDFKINYFLQKEDSDHFMIIDKIEITTDEEQGNHFIISGKDVVSIMARRVFYNRWNLNSQETLGLYIMTNVSDGLRGTDNVNIENTYRIVDIIKSGILYDELATGTEQYVQVSEETSGLNLYEDTSKRLKKLDTGIMFKLNDGKFICYLYKGKDLSDKIIFSGEFNNLNSSNYKKDYSGYKNSCFAYHFTKKTLSSGLEVYGNWGAVNHIGNTIPSGLDRYECSYDNGNMDFDSLTDDQIKENMQNSAYLELLNHYQKDEFDAEVDFDQFKYRTDYSLGDIVKISNDFGITAKARVTEITEVYDDKGYSINPKIEVI